VIDHPASRAHHRVELIGARQAGVPVLDRQVIPVRLPEQVPPQLLRPITLDTPAQYQAEILRAHGRRAAPQVADRFQASHLDTRRSACLVQVAGCQSGELALDVMERDQAKRQVVTQCEMPPPAMLPVPAHEQPIGIRLRQQCFPGITARRKLGLAPFPYRPAGVTRRGKNLAVGIAPHEKPVPGRLVRRFVPVARTKNRKGAAPARRKPAARSAPSSSRSEVVHSSTRELDASSTNADTKARFISPAPAGPT
jgi:hypothetical protein